MGLGIGMRRIIPAGGTAQPWVRPADWLPLPVPTAGSQVFSGLLAVLDNDSNYVALLVNGSTGYTVDWGDGTTTNHTANTKAQHKYDYSTIPSSTFSTRGYRQVIVTVTMQSSGNMTTFNLNQRHDRFTANTNIPWLDFNLNSPNLTSITIGGTTVTNGWLERAGIYEVGTLTSAENMFLSCYSLQTVPLFNTASVTNMSSMFNSCYSLQTVPLFNTASVTTMSSMFTGCVSLQTVPLFNTASVTNMSSMFNLCYSLQTVPLFNTASVTNMQSMLRSCFSLEKVPALNMSAVTTGNFANIFNTSRSVSRCEAFGAKFAISFNGCKLNRAELVEIFTNLGTASGSQTIDIRLNHGVADLTAGDELIATNKGWTIQKV
jgi:surface protein